MQEVYHVTTVRNYQRILVEGLFPRIGRNAKAAGETIPAVYCFASREQVENALSNWLGEQFDEPLAILIVDVNGLKQDNPVEWETRVFENIHPRRIQAVEDEYGRPLPMRTR